METTSSDSRESQVQELIEESTDLWEQGELAEALQKADQACSLDPSSHTAHHCRAAALAELGRLAEAREACERGLELAGEDAEAMLFAADLYLSRLDDDAETRERGLALARRAAETASRAGDAELQAECLVLQGIAEEQQGALPQALDSIERAAAIIGPDPDVLIERAIVLFEMCRFDDARKQVEQILEEEPDLAAAHHYLALLEERRGDAAAAELHFREAQRLEPEEFPEPVHLSAEEFGRAVEEALEELPPKIRDYLRNVAIAVEDIPTDDDLRAEEPPLSPQLLGMFRGTPLGAQSVMDPWSHFPSSIVLYQRNLERFAVQWEYLIEEIAVTLRHEVGHFLGLDEKDLAELGLE